MNFYEIFKRTAAVMVSVAMVGAIAFASEERAEIEEIAAMHPISGLTAGETNSDWYAYGIGKAGIQDDYNDYLSRLGMYVLEKYSEIGGLDKNKVTEWHRIALAVNALGGDPTDFGGINLIKDGITEPIVAVDRQGINGLIWAAITAQECGTDIGDTLTDICRKIVAKQNADGGFSLRGESDPDITAMAIIALWNAEDFRPYGELARAALINMRLPGGGYSSYGVENCESSAQAAQAFSYIGDVENARSSIEQVKKYKTEGGYAHVLDGEANNMSSWQAMHAFIAYENMQKSNTAEVKSAETESAASQVQGETAIQAVSPSVQMQENKADETVPADNSEEQTEDEETVSQTEQIQDEESSEDEVKETPQEDKEESESPVVTVISVVAAAALAVGAYLLSKRKLK